jgi:hypothetical protein
VGAHAGGRARARRGARHGLLRWHLHPRPLEGGRGGQEGATPAEQDTREALGRSRDGYGTKAVVIADAAGRKVTFKQAPSQARELPHAVPLLEHLPDVPGWVGPTTAPPAMLSASASGT